MSLRLTGWTSLKAVSRLMKNPKSLSEREPLTSDVNSRNGGVLPSNDVGIGNLCWDGPSC